MCQTEKTSKKRISASTSTFCSVVTSTEGVMSGLFRCHGLQLRHVLMICGIIAITTAGNDAAPKIRSIGARGACHHLKCSLRTSSNRCSSVPCRNTRRLLSELKLVQSRGTLSWLRSGCGDRGCKSGPRRLVLFCFRAGGSTNVGGVRASATGSLDPLDGPDVSSLGDGFGSFIYFRYVICRCISCWVAANGDWCVSRMSLSIPREHRRDSAVLVVGM